MEPAAESLSVGHAAESGIVSDLYWMFEADYVSMPTVFCSDLTAWRTVIAG